MLNISRPEKKSPAQDRGQIVASKEESVALAAYIGDMSAELAQLAGQAGLPMLAYFLNLARVEAQIYARENDGKEPKRR